MHTRPARSRPRGPPALRAILDRLDPTPAHVVNHLADVLAWNDGYDRLARPVGVLDGDVPNLLWFTFTDERARDAYPDWADIADQQVAELHRFRRGDPAADALAAQLARTAGPAFLDRWEKRPLTDTRTTVTAVNHPAVGLLRLTVETLEPPDRDHQRLLIHLPADVATATGLDRLAGRQPDALRWVFS